MRWSAPRSAVMDIVSEAVGLIRRASVGVLQTQGDPAVCEVCPGLMRGTCGPPIASNNACGALAHVGVAVIHACPHVPLGADSGTPICCQRHVPAGTEGQGGRVFAWQTDPQVSIQGSTGPSRERQLA